MISLSAAFAIGGAALAGWNSVAMTGGDCCVLLSADAELEQMVQAKDAAAVAAASSRVEVVAILKNDITAEASWEVWLANMALAASLGAVDKTVLVTWLANFHVASSSAKVARSFVLDDYDESEEDGEGETLYLFYLRSGTHDAQHGCMQVRVCGDVLTIDALCSLGNHSGEAFMKHLVEWLPAAAPRVKRMAVMPLSDGWLRQDYYTRLGFVSKPEGSGVMTRGVEAFG